MKECCTHDDKKKFYQRLRQYKDYALRMIYEYYKEDLIHIVESDPDRILSELERWTKLKIENYRIIKQALGDTVIGEMLVQDIFGAGRDDVIGFWKYLYSLRKSFPHPNILAALEEIHHRGHSLVEKILLDKYGHNLSPELRDIQEDHKKHLLEKTQRLVEHRPPGSTQEQQTYYISERYVNLIVDSSDHFRQRFEHELIETGRRHEDVIKKERRVLEHMTINKLFRWSCQKQCDPCVVMVSGVPGVGKTTMMQKFVYDWVTGKLYQRFAFVFFFKFRELNRLKRISLETMILQEYPHLQSHLENILQNPEKLLFIFDGLDESYQQMDFTSSQLCTNPQWPESCGLVVVSLLRQSLLRGCSVILTSRPTKLASIDTGMFHRVSEVMGFSPREIQMYFDSFFQNKELSEKAFHHVRENDTLYTFCYIPSYCWIICTVLSVCFKTQPTNSDQLMSLLPKTVTQLFVTFISHILSNHSQDTSRAKELMTSIGWMAEHGVMNNIIVFDERDLRSFNVDNFSHLTSSFIIESYQPPNVTFSFLHLTVQEFLAALAHYIDYTPHKLWRSLNKIKLHTDGRGEMLLRFICGFLDSSSRSLSKYLGDFPISALKDVTSWLQKSFVDVHVDGNIDVGKHLNIFSCLYESQNRILVEQCLGSHRNFSLNSIDHLSPVDCTVLAFVLMSCRETESLDIQKCNIQSEGWERLKPVLHTIKTIKLSTTEQRDSCLHYITTALLHPDCRTQHLEFLSCGITEESCRQLASVISSNQSLRTLNLSGNNLSGRHFSELMAALSSPTCHIQKLQLKECGITEESCLHLASAISNNQSLRTLDLSHNDLSGRHFSELMAALSSPTCRIQELLFLSCGITGETCPQLAFVISNNQYLRTLNLSHNNLTGRHFSELMEALSRPTCHIQKLQLLSCGIIEESCPQLASAISNNQSLRTLDLSHNNLSGCHFSELMTALSSSSCQIQELLLRNCRITEESCPQLASVISNNQSLRTLDLSYNNLSGGHFSELMAALSSPTCHIQELLLSSCGIIEESCAQLASAIRNNQSLRTLDLSNNNLSGRHFSELMTALSSSSCQIQELLLRNCRITEESCPHLASVISNNQYLRTLDLSYNNLSGYHFSELMAALSSPTCHIQELLLLGSHLTDEDAPHLVSLSNNTNLTHLDLTWNNFQDQGYNAIRDLIQRSPSLTEIKLFNAG